MRIQTESVKFKASDDLLEFIDRKLGKLDRFFDRIIEAQVTLRLENAGQIKDKIVEVQLALPGENIFVKEVNKTFEAGIEAAVDVLKRQLVKHKEQIRS